MAAVFAPSGCLPRDEELGREKRPSASATASARTTPAAASGASSGSASRKGTPAKLDPDSLGPVLTEVFTDAFERAELGEDYRTSAGGAWRIRDGQVCGQGARNQPLWLTRRLPVNAHVEFDATSYSKDGDIKVELWGDGNSGATSVSYTNATSYLAIFGGWKNSLHVLARLDEHGKDRKELRLVPDDPERRTQPVNVEQTYRFKVERRDGKTVHWRVDDVLIHDFEDAEPLSGDGHDHFGFNNWQARVCFDNLRIQPLGD